ncbi:MAG TPA: hypothetical protein VF173_28425 [Thermoanaerobaculia bacterium]|nr:hypothetical protein [Thermoanaerobaculia bacterium]
MIQVTNSAKAVLGTGRVGSAALFPREIPILSPVGQLTASGVSSVELAPPLRLPRNAVVTEGFKVTVRAGRAEWAIAKSVGQLRQQGASMVVDFGVLRTVAGVGVLDASKIQIVGVRQWMGTAFADSPVAGSTQGGPAVLFASQIRTERLQIDLASTNEASDALLLQLPDLPADLELRINGGAPVWTAPGPVIAGSRGWSAAGASGLASQQVDLAAALNAVLADPTADIATGVDLHVVLAARVPGALAIDPPENAGEGVLYLAQVTLPPGAEQVSFSEEGLKAVPLPLPLPPWVQSVETVKLTLAAKLPPERAVPPLGPDAEPVAAGSSMPLAEMALDPERAAVVAFPALDPQRYALGELVAVRLPLRAGAGGAEVRVLLLAGGGGQPGAALPGAVSKPVELSAASPADGDVWSTFAFPQAIPLDPAQPPFVAILVTRGQVRWAFTGDAVAGEVRFGSPDGPWQRLPGTIPVQGGRIRLVGHAPAGQPVAPLEVGLAGGAARVPVTPVPKGVTVEVAGPVAVPVDAQPPAVTLEVVGLTAGTVTLSGVVVTATRKTMFVR